MSLAGARLGRAIGPVRGVAFDCDGVLLVNLASLRAGSLPVPKFLGIVPDRITAETFKDEEARQAFATIHHLEIAPDGGLRIGVYPERISSLIRVLVSGD